MLDLNLRRTWASEALGNISFCSFSTDCRVKTQVAPSSRTAEAFSDLLKFFIRGREGVYSFCKHMQATAPIL